MLRVVFCFASLLLFGLVSASAEAAPPVGASSLVPAVSASPDTASTSKPSESLEAKIGEIQERIAAIEGTLAKTGEAKATLLATHRDLLKFQLALVYQHQATVEAIGELAEELAAQEKELARQDSLGVPSPPPYSLLMVEGLRDQLAATTVQGESIEAEIATTENLLGLVRQTSAERERERRAVRDRMEGMHGGQASGQGSAELETAVLLAEVARETIDLREAQLQELQIKQRINAIRRKSLEGQIGQMAGEVRFSEGDLKSVLERLEGTESAIQRQIEAAGASLQEVQEKWLEAKEQSEKSPGNPLTAEAAKAWQLARDCRQKEMAVLNQRVASLAILRTLWQARYAMFHKTASVEAMSELREKLANMGDQLGQAKRLADLDFEQCRTDLALLEMRLNQAREQQPQLASWLQFEADQLKHLMGTHAKVFLEQEASSVFLDRFGAELDRALGNTGEFAWKATLKAWASAAWNYELTSIHDEPITTKKLVVALIFLLVGWGVSRYASRALGRRVLPRFGLDGGNAVALQTIAFYLLLVLFGYFSLELVGVPLTVFAFLGGAVAIGVGFGSQNVLNNFISGLILLFERPIRVGDLVNIDGLYGTVERVGARSTRVKTGSNLEMIIPNSRFLENNVTNLTLSDERFRACVAVGVAYGSPTHTVAELLEQAVREHPDVLNAPDPIVLFKDFADNSLNFEVHFWIRMRTQMQGQRIESDVRHAINALFEEADITIAFPQRDVHLDMAGPIEVRLPAAEEDASSSRVDARAA